MFSGKSQVPCVGISFGIDRIFSITKARMAAQKTTEKPRKNDVDIFVMAFGGGKDFTGLLKERSQICARLWDAGIKVGLLLSRPISAEGSLTNYCKAEFLYKVKPKLPQQFKAAEQNGVPFALILGEDELAQGKVRIKEMGLPADHPLKEGELISLDRLEAEAQQRLSLKKQVDSIARQAAGLRVVHGIKGDEVKAAGGGAASGTATEQPAAAAVGASEVEEKKPAEGSSL